MEITAKQLQEKINKGEKIIVKFAATWCGPCRMLNPVYQMVSESNDTEVQMYSMDVDQNREYALELGIRSVPTIKVFDSGKLVETKIGAIQENEIKGMIKTLVNG
jgi:thioredoxin 1